MAERDGTAADAPAAGPASARVLALFEGRRLTPTQRRIAHVLVEHAAQAAFLTSGELAALTGVSQPSVTRFAIALGYQGYPALRRELRKLHTSGDVAPEYRRRNSYQHAVSEEIGNLERLTQALADPAPVQRAGRLLASSRPLVVLGQRVSAPLAHQLAFLAAKFHPDVRLVTSGGSDAADQLEQARTAGASAALAVVMPRYPRESIRLLAACRRLGMSVVTITDAPVSPAAEHSDVVLPAAVGTGLVFDSHAAPMVLGMVLLEAMCDASQGVQERLEEFESSAEERRIFMP